MATCTNVPEGRNQSCTAAELPSTSPAARHVVEIPTTASIPKNVLKPQAAAKAIIEATLFKSAGVLSKFTENISQTSPFFNQILSPERFGFPSSSRMIQNRKLIRPKSAKANPNVSYNGITGRKTPDITKLPNSIANILEADSNSSIPSLQKSKKYHYHSKKMSLKQRDDFNKENGPPSLTTVNENTVVPKIVIVSTPLASQQQQDSVADPATKSKRVQETANNSNSNDQQTKLISRNPEYPNAKSLLHHLMTTAVKTEKKTVTSVNASSVVKKKPEKVNIGVDNGDVFILGSKTKSPYFNSFADSAEEGQSGENPTLSSNRKWVVNVGNFADEEISLTLMGNNLTITGVRQPSLNYPEGQTVSETIALPPQFDVNKLRIYRGSDATAFLVIQDKQ